MSVTRYLGSLISPKKIFYKKISPLSIWDNHSRFERTTSIFRGAKVLNSQIGAYSRIGMNTVVGGAKIGNFSVVSMDSVVSPGAHPTNFLTPHVAFYQSCPWHPEWIGKIDFPGGKIVNIGNDVWIGRNCIIMDGVTIGDGAIIAAGAIVTKDIPPYAIAGGIPAKVIKFRFPQEMIDRLEEIKWWNLPDEEITRVIDLFHTANPTMEDLNRYFPPENN